MDRKGEAVKKPEAASTRKTVRPTKAAAPTKSASRKKTTAPKRDGGGPSTASDHFMDSEWVVGPYGDLMSKKDLGLLVTTRTRVS
jgi:hypothetical protein